MYLHCNKKADSEPDRGSPLGRYFYVSKDLQRCLSCNVFITMAKSNAQPRHIFATESEIRLIEAIREKPDYFINSTCTLLDGVFGPIELWADHPDEKHREVHTFYVRTVHAVGELQELIQAAADSRRNYLKHYDD